MVNAGARITFDVVGSVSGWLPSTVQGVREPIVSDLAANFAVHDVTIAREDTLFGPSSAYWNWRYRGVATITTKTAYAKIEDVDSIVAHAFYQGAGELPTVTARGYEPGQGVGAASGLDWGTWLTGGGIVVGLVAVAVLVVVVKAR
jgi:hypothetical protein